MVGQLGTLETQRVSHWSQLVLGCGGLGVTQNSLNLRSYFEEASGDDGGYREVSKVWETGGSGWTGILGSEGAFVE